MARKRKSAFSDEEAKQIEDAIANKDNRKGENIMIGVDSEFIL